MTCTRSGLDKLYFFIDLLFYSLMHMTYVYYAFIVALVVSVMFKVFFLYIIIIQILRMIQSNVRNSISGIYRESNWDYVDPI